MLNIFANKEEQGRSTWESKFEAFEAKFEHSFFAIRKNI